MSIYFSKVETFFSYILTQRLQCITSTENLSTIYRKCLRKQTNFANIGNS